MRTHPTKRRVALVLAPVLAAGLALGACGDDDDTATTDATDAPAASTDAPAATTSADTAAAGEDLDTFCTKSVEIEAAFAGPPLEEGDVAGAKALLESVLPLAREWAAAAPAGVRSDVELMLATAEGATETGDLSVFETPEFGAADANAHAAGLESCGWAVQNVELQDYHFEGLPESLPAGVTSFELTNTGEEFHELALLRKNDGVTESFEEILALPEEEAFSKVTPAGQGFAAPGEPGYALIDMPPGDYLAICFLPVGATPDGPPPEDGAPHFTEGMSHELTVS